MLNLLEVLATSFANAFRQMLNRLQDDCCCVELHSSQE